MPQSEQSNTEIPTKQRLLSEAHYCVPTKQEQFKVGLNSFAIELLAESFEQRLQHPDGGFDEGVCVIGYGKDRKPVYITISPDEPHVVNATTYTPIYDEGQRQILLLALHQLKKERPGWADAITRLEAPLGGQLNWPE